ncbi:MAG: peptide deformylase [Bacteroidetes bacterium]|nr:peptide deformylase [Bacteroidota bacterium]
MNLPIVAYGHPTLRKVCAEIDKDYPGLDELIKNMWDTLYHTNGVGLAAPQVNHAIRLFLVDSIQIVEGADEEDKDDFKDEKPLKQIFINPYIIDEIGNEWKYNEGCLSIPKIREDVMRKPTITIQYQDENFESHTQTFEGITARVIQHEYDHIEGKLFIDKLSPLKRRLLKSKLDDISRGKVKVSYKMMFPK